MIRTPGFGASNTILDYEKHKVKIDRQWLHRICKF